MPEIKNNFSQGKMNKDLDERIIPNGQYRDAMNIQVATSEGSDVGTVQNILGNTRVDVLGELDNGQSKCVGAIADEKNNVLYWFISGESIGGVPGKDMIIEYHNDGTVTPVFVDLTGGVLQFDYNSIITGINIIDDLLFWTDGVNEPKKINIKRSKQGTADTMSQTQLVVNDEIYTDSNSVTYPVEQEHITVIKRKPSMAPTVKFEETTIEPVFTSINEINFTDGNNNFLQIGDTSVVIKIIDDPTQASGPDLFTATAYQNWKIGDTLLLSKVNSPGNLPQNQEVKALINAKAQNQSFTDPNTSTVYSVTSITLELEEISSNLTMLDSLFEITKEVDEEVIFEKDFIRFGTRWKYEDGEYSAYSPFTQPIFLAGPFGFHPTRDPYNLGMSNKMMSLKLQDLITPDVPKDVVQIDILFKKENSTVIYSVDSIKPTDLFLSGQTANHWLQNDYADYWGLDPTLTSWNMLSHLTTENTGYSGEYNISTENIYAALPENQMLRPWDNVPRKALAQEITANRIVYGNYLQNYDIESKEGGICRAEALLDIQHRNIGNNLVNFVNSQGKKSIKSKRTYHLGVVYGDKYGRETPVFSSETSNEIVKFDGLNGGLSASQSLSFKARTLGAIPKNMHYQKYFIKQTTGEYYNLTMDRVYKADGDDNLWLSFPSSDRNKIQEGDYFSIKKQVDFDSQIPVDNKIKIIDIKSNAPDSIKFKYSLMGTGGTTAEDLNNLFPDSNARPAVNVKRISVDRQTWIDTEFGMDLKTLTPSDRIAIQFRISQGGTNVLSKKYHVSTWMTEDAGDDGRYNFLLEDTIDEADSWVESSSGVLNATDGLTILIYSMMNIPASEFEGRFFVKIISSPVTQQYLIPSATNNTEDYQIVARAYTFWLADNNQGPYPTTTSTYSGVFNVDTEWAGSQDGSQSSGLGNTDQQHGSAATKTQDNWRKVTRFNGTTDNNSAWFLDNVYFVSAQEPGGPFAVASKNNEWDVNKSGKMHKGSFGNITVGGVSTSYNSNQFINTMEGIITTGPTTKWNFSGGNPNGPGHWGSHAAKFQEISGTFQEFTHPDNVWDTTYESLSGSNTFMHLSFSCVGVDLHDGEFPDGYAPSTSNNHFAENLQWIASSGIYVQGNHDDDLGNNFYEFGTNSTSALEAHDRQFDPTFMSGSSAGGVINRLTVGSQFKFDGDPHTTYEIKKVSVKYLYNHTCWNPRLEVRSDGTVNYNTHEKSVSRALDDYLGGNIGVGALKERIIDFGKANNRRVVYILELSENPTNSTTYNPLDASQGTMDHDSFQTIRFIDNHVEPGVNTIPISPAIFETEAKEDQDLNIYYEASNNIPLFFSDRKSHVFAPVGSQVWCALSGSMIDYSVINDNFAQNGNQVNANGNTPEFDFYLRVAGWEDNGKRLVLDTPGLKLKSTNPDDGSSVSLDLAGQSSVYAGRVLRFYRPDLSYTVAKIGSVDEITGNYITKVNLQGSIAQNATGLPYYNCFSFGNGVESNRIRDDFNETFIRNGVKASTVLEEEYKEEHRKYGLIYSGLYNSTSGVNNLNQFIQAEKITKDIMPTYGSIQKLYARDKDLITLCEDKILQIYVDKDVLYNADGNSQLLATNRVLGTAEPFRGNFGISKNPESFASESFRAYFTDKQRGAVVRLSMDGLTPISDAGMTDWFRDNLKDGGRLYGSYDLHKKDYNLTIFYADGSNILLNPGFETGGSYTTNLLSEVLTNESFNDTTTHTISDIIDNGAFFLNTTLASNTFPIDDGYFNAGSEPSTTGPVIPDPCLSVQQVVWDDPINSGGGIDDIFKVQNIEQLYYHDIANGGTGSTSSFADGFTYKIKHFVLINGTIDTTHAGNMLIGASLSSGTGVPTDPYALTVEDLGADNAGLASQISEICFELDV